MAATTPPTGDAAPPHPTLAALFTGACGTGRRPGRAPAAALPPGRIIRTEEDDRPALWLSDDPAPPGLWAQFAAEHPATGLWPLLVDPDDHGRSGAAAPCGELYEPPGTPIADHDADTVLAARWAEVTEPDEPDETEEPAPGEQPQPGAEDHAPFGRRWPGLAPATGASPAAPTPQAHAAATAAALAAARPGARLGLVAADRSADAPAGCGWSGPVNYTGDMSAFSAVLRSWEDRFGARVVGMGFDTLLLSVASPPRDEATALRVAAEHHAFCPDNVWQNTPGGTLARYAASLVGEDVWSFWWD